MLWWILGAVLLLLLLVVMFVAVTLFCLFVRRHSENGQNARRHNRSKADLPPFWQKHLERIAKGKEWIATLRTEDIYINASDSTVLHALLIPATAPTNNFILAIHGYTSNCLDDYAAYVPFYRDLGYNMLLVDCRAHGKSGGKYITFGYFDRYDCTEWFGYIIDRFGTDVNIALHGISMGAATAIMTAGERPNNLRGVIADCGYTCIWDEFKYILKHRLKASPIISLWFSNILNRLFVGYNFKECHPVKSIKQAQCPFLFIHGSADNFVPAYMIDRLYEACPTQKEKLLVKDAPHAMSFWVDTPLVSQYIVGFLSQINM